ncbi:MAG: fumarylacetoacetate hydrolase family protein [Candidatus Latescibacteria bacterium]|jgi:2-keto-4-pentenoate hydratase/2-oxohepta-3-ene-1,7-dioic acid hydratase in catechol pathway|nr:fumarylacetoacetate hydrolase family protein [Candidatus Latescibacterota bacterium]
MKILRYREHNEIHYGVLEDDGTINQLVGSPFEGLDTDGVFTNINKVTVLAPVPQPRLIGVGLNYAAHAAEGGKEPPPIPMLFMLPWTAVIGQGDQVVYPVQGQNIEYEGELVVVIGKETKDVSEADALDHVLGYTCGNDISERVIQRQEMSQGCMLMGKGFDTFKPMGPYIATDLDPTDLELTTRLNGEIRQHTSTSDLIFPVAKLIEYISDAITLLPGDVIYTGTPAGVGPVEPGDSVEVEIGGIGILKNTIVAEEA